MPREHHFDDEVRRDAWMRQNDNCACCGKNLEKQAHKQGSLPHAHHAVPNQSGDLSRDQDPWMSSQDNCVYLCNDCHNKAHEDGKYRDGAVATPDKFKYSHGDYNDPEVREKHEEWCKRVNEKWDQKHERYQTQEAEKSAGAIEEPSAQYKKSR